MASRPLTTSLRTAALTMLATVLTMTVYAQGSTTKSDDKGTLVYENTFEGKMGDWIMTDKSAWKHLDEEGGKVLALVGKSDYKPEVRSPLNIARIKDLEVEDFVIDVKVKQTGREYGHRDLCFFFGYQDPSHFYYVHIASKSDPHANSIFIVNGEPRVSIATERNDGTKWSEDYHNVRITRDTKSGAIAVYFDDMEKPIMKAEDKTFLKGGVGFGSFDDTGNFDDVKIWEKKKIEN